MNRRVVIIVAVAGMSTGSVYAQPATDTSKCDAPVVASIDLGYAGNTYVPEIAVHQQMGVYIPEVTLPVTILAKDPYNGNKISVSWAAAIPIGAAMAVGVIHTDDAPGLRNFLMYAIFIPALALNCQHHVLLAGPGGFVNVGWMRLSIFAGWRTDCYSPDITWLRWTPMAGIQQAFRISDDADETTGKWIAVAAGIERPVGTQAPPSRLFAGLKYYFPANLHSGDR